MVAGNNTFTITMTGGSFKAAPIVAADFTFAGTNAAAIAAGTFTRTSANVVTITGVNQAIVAANNTVAVPAATQATQGTSVAMVATAEAAPVISTVMAGAPIAANNTFTVTLSGGTFKTGIAIGDLTFAGTDAVALAAGTVNYLTTTTISITGVTGLTGINNTVTIKASGINTVTGVLSASWAPSTGPVAVVSALFGTTAGHTSLQIDIDAGTYKAAPIVKGDFIFAGPNADAYNAAGVTFTRTGATRITLTGIVGVTTSVTNQVTVKALTQATTGATIVTGTSLP
jgi:hypothetical protein